jgi:hypothetical protein
MTRPRPVETATAVNRRPTGDLERSLRRLAESRGVDYLRVAVALDAGRLADIVRMPKRRPRITGASAVVSLLGRRSDPYA